MSKRTLPPAFACTMRFVVAGAALLCWLAIPRVADAASALVRWLPPLNTSVTGYGVYVRNAGSTYGSSPIWSGNPTPAADGSMSAVVAYTPATSGTNYFAVVAVANGTESDLSQERPIGTPDPCREDRCASKSSCIFSNLADGTPCDDDSFCNGPEICVSGVCDASQSRNCADPIACTVDACSEEADQCTHVGPPGCCLACDTTDPCLADACAAGDCSAPEGVDIEINRLKLVKKAETIKLVGRARFVLDSSVDPSTTGAVIELRTPEGALLYSSTIAPSLLHAGAANGRYRYTASRVAAAQQSNGVTRLDFRVKSNRWLVTVMADAPTLSDASVQPSITVALRLGDVCLRRMAVPCNPKESLSVCRLSQ